MTRPEDLIYAVDERPPLLRLIFLGLQHAVLMSVYPVLIVIVFRHADDLADRPRLIVRHEQRRLSTVRSMLRNRCRERPGPEIRRSDPCRKRMREWASTKTQPLSMT